MRSKLCRHWAAMFHSILNMLTFVAIAIPLIGCQSLYTTSVEETQLGLLKIEGNFNGFQSIATGGSSIHALIVHGMTSRPPHWSLEFQDTITAKIQYARKSSRDLSIPVRLEDGQDPVVANLAISVYECNPGPTHVCNNQPQLVLYEVTWSPVTDPFKAWIRSVDARTANLQSAGEGRQSVNGEIVKFFTDAFTDPVYYLANPAKIQEPVSKAICAMLVDDYLTDAWQNSDPCRVNHPDDSIADISNIELRDADIEQIRQTRYVFFTYSLGSRILVDTLVRMTNPPQSRLNRIFPGAVKNRAALQEFKSSVTNVYMFANQLSLFDACHLNIADSGKCDDRPILLGASPRQSLTLVAFVDPNDFLSYPIEDRMCQRFGGGASSVQCANVFVSVATTAYNVRGRSDLRVVNPADAHTRYDADPVVLDCLLFGAFGGNGGGRCSAGAH